MSSYTSLLSIEHSLDATDFNTLEEQLSDNETRGLLGFGAPLGSDVTEGCMTSGEVEPVCTLGQKFVEEVTELPPQTDTEEIETCTKSFHEMQTFKAVGIECQSPISLIDQDLTGLQWTDEAGNLDCEDFVLYPGAPEEGQFLKSIAEPEYLSILPQALNGDNGSPYFNENTTQMYNTAQDNQNYPRENRRKSTRKSRSSKRLATRRTRKTPLKLPHERLTQSTPHFDDEVMIRATACDRERKRMMSINSAFDELREQVPTFPYEKRLSKIDTLRLAIAYIGLLKDVLRSNEEPRKFVNDFVNGRKQASAEWDTSDLTARMAWLKWK